MLLDKSGSPPESCVELVQHIMDTCPSLQFSGIMTIGALARSVQQEETNEDFEVGVFSKIITCRSKTVANLTAKDIITFLYNKFSSLKAIETTDN